MKILLLSYGIPSKQNPQFGCFAMDQAKALKAAGHEVAILSMNNLIGKQWKKPGVSHWQQDGIECFEVFGLPNAILIKAGAEPIANRLIKWGSKKGFKKVIKEFGFPDIVHAHFLFSMVMGAAIKEKYPITLVGTEHWSKLAEPQLSPRIIRDGKYAYPKVDQLISVSKNLAECVKRNFGKESIVIHNLFNTEILRPALPKTNNSQYTISAVGSLIHRKGFDVLIKAFAESKLSDANVVINIYGKGEAREELEKLIAELHLEGKVNLFGQKTKAELYDALHHSDLFVLSSRLENFSVAIIEATGNGLPAVATLCGGIEEYPIRDVIKIPTDNVPAMKEALEKAYDNRKNIDRLAIQKETIENFSPEAIVKQIEKVYDKLLSEKTNR